MVFRSRTIDFKITKSFAWIGDRESTDYEIVETQRLRWSNSLSTFKSDAPIKIPPVSEQGLTRTEIRSNDTISSRQQHHPATLTDSLPLRKKDLEVLDHFRIVCTSGYKKAEQNQRWRDSSNG